MKIYETGKKNITKIDNFQSKISFDIILDGEFMSVVSFFYSLNNLSNLVNAEDFAVDPISDKTNSTRLVLKGTFSVFKFEME